jgi:hypothetical protein
MVKELLKGLLVGIAVKLLDNYRKLSLQVGVSRWDGVGSR